MKQLAGFCGWMLWVAALYAQSADTTKASRWLREAQIWYDSAQYDRSLQLAQKAEQVFLKNENNQGRVAECLLLKGNIFWEKDDLEEAEASYRAALKLSESIGKTVLTGQAHNNLGELYFKIGDYAGAAAAHRLALQLRQQLFGESHPDVADSYNNLGNCFFAEGNYWKATEYHATAFQIRSQLLPADHPDIAVSRANLGNCELALGHFAKAEQHHRAALALRTRIFGESHPKTTASMVAVAKCLAARGDSGEALRTLETAAAIQRNIFGESHPAIANTYEIAGDVCMDRNDTKQALRFYEKALQIRRTNFPENHPAMANGWNNIGLCLLQIARPAEAKTYFEKAFQSAMTSVEKAVFLKNRGLASAKMGKTDAAMTDFQQALDLLGYSPKGVLKNKSEVLAVLLAQIEALQAARAKGSVLEEVQNQAFRVVEALQTELLDAAARTRLNEQIFQIFERAISTQIALWRQTERPAHLQKAFEFSEKSKSLQLLEAVRASNAVRFAGVPEATLATMNELQRQVAFLERQQFGESEFFAKADSLRKQLDGLVRQIETTHPNYFKLKLKPATAPLETIQNLLKFNHQTLLEYFVGDSSIVVFIVEGGSLDAVEIKKNFPLEAWVTALRLSVETYPRSNGDAARQATQAYAELAYQLFQKLHEPVAKNRHLSKNLVIVPDGALHFLPFEILLSQKPDDPSRFKNHAYLLRDFRISYVPSAALLAELTDRPRLPTNKKLLAVAPVFIKNQYGLAELRHNIPEAVAVAKMFDGDILTSEKATLDAFLETGSIYQILLLATHGEANPRSGDYSWLAFTEVRDTLDNELLYASDLYNQRWAAELVVLSACESGVGELRRSEGLLSMTRGFFFAGARSLVSTLWSVDDARNSELITLFFQKLKNNLSASDALHNAKLDYLKHHPHDEAHPVYWAGAVLLGDGQFSVTKPEKSWQWWYLGGAGVLLALLWWVKFSKSKK